MESSAPTVASYICVKHNGPNDIYCTVCSTFICAECISDHGVADSHKPKYMYILQYAANSTLPKLDALKKKSHEQARNADSEFEELQNGLKELLPVLKEAADTHVQTAAHLKGLGAKLANCAKQKIKGNCADNMNAKLKADKEALQKAIAEKNQKNVLQLAQRLDEEIQLVSKQITATNLMELLKAQLLELNQVDTLKGVVNAAKAISTKYSLWKVTSYIKEWKCDRKYLSSKMSLSEDGLVFGNTASSGYPAIIGDVPFDYATYAFEVIPENLDCSKEGFGIVEASKYFAAYKTDAVTPTVFSDMLGLFYNGDAKNMTIERIRSLESGAKYFIRVNMNDLTMTLTGPGVSLKANLQSNTIYYPCFSCGCTKNKIRIRPLNSFDEPDPSFAADAKAAEEKAAADVIAKAAEAKALSSMSPEERLKALKQKRKTEPCKVSVHSHPLKFVVKDNGWGCDGRNATGGCRSGTTSFHQTTGMERYRCESCDYDLCLKCLEAHILDPV